MELEEIYEQIQPRIYAFFYVKTNSKEAAEDLTQEVFYQALKSSSSFSGQSSLQTWMFAIAKNLLSKFYRTKKYREGLTHQLSQEERQRESSPEHMLIKKEEQVQLLQLIQGLDELSKEVVTLRMYAELSFKEIGEVMGKSENYVRVTFHRAKLKLHKELEGYHGEE